MPIILDSTMKRWLSYSQQKDKIIFKVPKFFFNIKSFRGKYPMAENAIYFTVIGKFLIRNLKLSWKK